MRSIFITAGVLFPVAVIFTHRAIAPAIIVAGLAVALRYDLFRRGSAYFLDRGYWREPLVLAGLFYLGFCIWIGVTGFWAPRAGTAQLALGALAPVLAGGAAVWLALAAEAAVIRRWSKWILAAGVTAVALLLVEAATGGAIRHYIPYTDSSPDRVRDLIGLGRGTTIVVGVSTALVALAYDVTARRFLALILFAAMAIAAAAFPIKANVVALAFAGAAYLIALKWPNGVLVALGALFASALLIALAAVFIPAERVIDVYSSHLPASSAHRLVIWQNAAREALECLPWGCGADFARVIHQRGEQFDMASLAHPLSLLPTHPHSLFLQVWLELGLPGVLLFSAACSFALKALLAAPLSRLEKAAAAGAIAAFTVSALVEFSFWQVWRVSAPLYAALIIAVLYRRRVSTPSFTREVAFETRDVQIRH